MTIPTDYRNRCVYHFTHLENLPDILKNGLLSTNEKKRLGLKHISIAYSDIQSRRSSMKVPCGSKGVVHDYVPLYFCKRSSMLLAVVSNKIADQQFIMYFEFPIDIMCQYPSVVTDSSANTSSPPNFYDDPDDLCHLKWKHIDDRKWGSSEKARQDKQAELLVHKRLDAKSASRIIVWNKSIKDKVIEAYNDAGCTPPPIVFDPYQYYTDFYDSGRHSIVTGPFFIKKAYQETVDKIIEEIGQAVSPKFKYLFFLLKELRENLHCLPETAEIIDLETDNEVHSEDVGKHTIRVAEELRKLDEFKNMNKIDKMLVELSAYLHDIGKGPKSRWVKNNGRQKVDPDHPIKALPMLQRILTEEIETMKPRSAKEICKLVCYHDLIGDIIGKGRRIEELIDVVEDKTDLNMLIALGKADMRAIRTAWPNDEKIEEIRNLVMDALQSEMPDE